MSEMILLGMRFELATLFSALFLVSFGVGLISEGSSRMGEGLKESERVGYRMSLSTFSILPSQSAQKKPQFNTQDQN